MSTPLHATRRRFATSAIAIGCAAACLPRLVSAHPSDSGPITGDDRRRPAVGTDRRRSTTGDDKRQGAASVEGRRLATWAETMLAEYWALRPDAALRAGWYAEAHRLALPDAASRARQAEFLSRRERELAGFALDRLTPLERLDATVLRQRFESERWMLEVLRPWAWQPSVHNVAGGLALLIETPFAPLEQRLAHVLARLPQVAPFYAAARASIDKPTLEHTLLAIQQHRGTLAVLGEQLAAAVGRASFGESEKARLLAAAATAQGAVREHVQWLEGLRERLAREGGRSFRLGRELYERKFELDIRAGVSVDALHQRALEAKAELHGRMETLARALWPKWLGNEEPPQDRLAMIGRVIDKLSERHARPEDFVATIRAQIPALERFVRERGLLEQDPTRPLEVRVMPAWQRGASFANVQSAGPYDPTAPTYYNVRPLDDMPPAQAASLLREYNDWLLQILNIHEAIPGHYTQLLHANKSPSRIKSLFGNGAMIEGWAVYSELMMLEAGWGAEPGRESEGAAPEMWLIWAKWNLRSVCNTLLDIALHTRGMERAQMMDLLVREAFQTEAEAAEKWRRATLTQVQLTSYFAGYSEIVALRREQKQRLGERFRLADFHNRFLSFGSVPVREIAALMNG